jgi:hypothetical protein
MLIVVHSLYRVLVCVVCLDRSELAEIQRYNEELAEYEAYEQMREYETSLPPAAPPSPPRMSRVKSDLSPAAQPYCPADGSLGADDDFSLLTNQGT